MDSLPAMRPLALNANAAVEEASCTEGPCRDNSLCSSASCRLSGTNWLFVRIKPGRPSPDRQPVPLAQQSDRGA